MKSVQDLHKMIRRRTKHRSLNRMDRLRFTHGLLVRKNPLQTQKDLFDFQIGSQQDIDTLLEKKKKLLSL